MEKMRINRFVFAVLFSCFSFAVCAAETFIDEFKELCVRTSMSNYFKSTYVAWLSNEIKDQNKHLILQSCEDKEQVAYELALMYYDDNIAQSIAKYTLPIVQGRFAVEGISRYLQNVRNIDLVNEFSEVYSDTYKSNQENYIENTVDVLREGCKLKDLACKAPDTYVAAANRLVDVLLKNDLTDYEESVNSYVSFQNAKKSVKAKALDYILRNDKTRMINYLYDVCSEDTCLADFTLAVETYVNRFLSVVANDRVKSGIRRDFVVWCMKDNRIKDAEDKAAQNPSKRLWIKSQLAGMDKRVQDGSLFTEEENEADTVKHQDVQPEYPGGLKELMKWLGQNMKYPKIAQKNAVDGRIFVRFVVDKDGSIDTVQTHIFRTISPMLDRADMLEAMSDNPKIQKRVSDIRKSVKALEEEALRVVKSMPKWTPGMRDGEPVRVRYTQPITFRTF